MDANLTPMQIPSYVWEMYQRLRPDDPKPIHVGDEFRLKPSNRLYKIKSIEYPSAKLV